jgi:hypothetical protein
MKLLMTGAPRVLLIPVVMGMIVAAAVGEEKALGTWAEVQKIQGGKAVGVAQGDSALLRGRLVSVAEDQMIVSVGGTDRLFARTALRSVAVQNRKTAKGALVGLLVGLALAYPSTKLQGAGAAIGGIVFDTAIGAAIGTLKKDYRTVYRITQTGPPTR